MKDPTSPFAPLDNPGWLDTPAEAPAPDLVTRLRALSREMVKADMDMSLPEGSIDPAEAADEITRLNAEVERLQSIIAAADRGSPIYKAIDQRLDEMSAWIARPNDEVTQAVALTAGIAWSIHYPLEVVEQNLSLQLDNHRLTAEVERLTRDWETARNAYDAECVETERLRAALEHTWKVIDAAGTLNLSNGVQLGPTVWYVKIEAAREMSNLALKEPRT